MYESHLVYPVYVFYITKQNGTFRILETFMEHIYHAKGYINPLSAELNPICHLLALLGAHHT